MNLRTLIGGSLIFAVFTQSSLAADIYLATGSDGEASFSDFALPDAVAVAVDVHEPSALEADLVRDRVRQTLAVAAELEAARLERERVYAERRALAARQAEQRIPEYEEPEYRVVSSGYFGGHFGYSRPHGGFHKRSHVGPHPRPRNQEMHRRHSAHGPVDPEPAVPPSRGRPLTRRSSG